MDSERFQKIREIFERALEQPPESREAFLREACPDPDLRAEVERLLLAAPTDSTVMDDPSTAATPSPRASEIDRRIGPYRLIRKVGEGGMGVVYEARQEGPVERTVALKIVRQGLDGTQVLARFEAERQALARMNHPNISRVYDAGTDEDGRPYFVMDYIRGLPVNDYCDRHNLNLRARIELMIQICDGVQHAHQKGVIHRDLKPSNVLVELQDNRAVPRIIDFGVAKAIDSRLTERTLFTEFGQIIGTPEYMSPEQAEMTGLDVDTRTDVYSLGVMLYELLTGALPFDSKELRRAGYAEIQRRIREDTPPKPSTRLTTMGEKSVDVAKHRSVDTATLVRVCRNDLDWVTMKTLEKDRTRRYATVSEFALDLRRYLNDEPVTAGPPSVGYRVRKFVRRHRIGVGMAALLAFAVLLGFAGTTYGLVRAMAAERQALLEAATATEVTDFMIGMFEISDPSEARGRDVRAREILDRARDRIRHDLTDRPGVQGRLLDAIGRVYRSLGLYTDARPLLEEAVVAAERRHGENHPEVARALNALAGLLTSRGDADAAGAAAERALRIQESTLPPGDLDRARTLNNLGNVARLKRDVAGALRFYEQSHSIRERGLGPDHREVAKMLHQIGWAHMQLEAYDDSRSFLDRALETYERVLGDDHPELGAVLLTRAQLERRVTRFDEARGEVARALAIQEKSLPAGHPDFVNTYFERAMLEEAAGDALAAREALEQALVLAAGPPRHRLWPALERLQARL